MMFLLFLSVIYRAWCLVVSVVTWPIRRRHLMQRNRIWQQKHAYPRNRR